MHNEVDFVVMEGKKVKQLIQVSYNISESIVKERETKALLLASEELHCGNLLVISEDHDTTEQFNNKTIRFIPLWKWLLQLDK